MICTFGDPEAEKLFAGEALGKSRIPADLQRVARRKLRVLAAAHDLRDLWSPPGNRPEKLKGSRAGQHSIRINDQWRITFRWTGGNAYDVRIEDYHS